VSCVVRPQVAQRGRVSTAFVQTVEDSYPAQRGGGNLHLFATRDRVVVSWAFRGFTGVGRWGTFRQGRSRRPPLARWSPGLLQTEGTRQVGERNWGDRASRAQPSRDATVPVDAQSLSSGSGSMSATVSCSSLVSRIQVPIYPPLARRRRAS